MCRKNKSAVFIALVASCVLTGCTCKKPALSQRDEAFIGKRDFIVNDPSVKVKPVFISLPAGAVSPQGWIRDCAVNASNGITGHLDEWSPTYGMAWKGVGFEARGADPKTGMGWPLEQASYWLDGAVRLAYILNDTALINKVSSRLDQVVDGVLNGGNSFIYWQNVDFIDRKQDFNNWAHSHMGRALVAYCEASGKPRVLEALTKVYGDFPLVSVPFHTKGRVSGCNNADPMLATYELSGDKRILNAVLEMAESAETKETVQKWNSHDYENGHGVIVYENLRIPAMLYPCTGHPDFLQATKAHLDWLDEHHLLPFGIASSEEHVAGIGATRNTETCNVATSAWTYQQLYEITGEGSLGDRIEKIFFNAAPAPVARDYQTMAYYQSPNRIEELMPSETPGHPGSDASSYIFRPTGHEVLCCVGNLTRAVPNYIMHIWMGTADRGLAATLYGPSEVNTFVGKDVPVKITTETAYPFEETIKMTVEPAKAVAFPLYLRIPEWCKQPEIKINGEPVSINSLSGFVKVDRKWKKGDTVDLNFPMRVEVATGRETAFPREDYFVKGGSSGRPLAHETEVNSPYRTVSYGPLLFAFPVKDINPNRQASGEKWNYALISEDAQSIRVSRSEMPATWQWQIEDAPVKLIAKAATFDWQPSAILPLPKEEVTGSEEMDITLVPYGCTKFRISMFPIAKK
ncbi:MAG: glycoside hydrolase family 127 protein [Tannerella sp.]|jgi:hypothetical protein|nr:glycoside hydrolase family 127 protein [Tannerella sp.]